MKERAPKLESAEKPSIKQVPYEMFGRFTRGVEKEGLSRREGYRLLMNIVEVYEGLKKKELHKGRERVSAREKKESEGDKRKFLEQVKKAGLRESDLDTILNRFYGVGYPVLMPTQEGNEELLLEQFEIKFKRIGL